MTMTDPIADMLTRLRNASQAHHDEVAMPYSKLKAGVALAKKKLGFRYLLDVIGFDATLVRGSHGRTDVSPQAGPLLITSQPGLLPQDRLAPTDVFGVILAHLGLAHEAWDWSPEDERTVHGRGD